jgi:hypothetical protein
MRTISWIFAFTLWASAASAQTAAVTGPARPTWDINFNIGAFGADPGQRAYPHNDWYSEGRYAASIGYYWTEHLKTELEFAHSGEGSRYIQDFAQVPGVGFVQPISIESFHRLQQGAARVVWQFGHNTWVHPYVNAGYVFDAERRHFHSPIQYYYPGGPPTRPPVLVRPELNSGRTYAYRHGVSLGAGSKFYVSPQAYINTGLQWTYAQTARTVTLLAGFGVEF